MGDPCHADLSLLKEEAMRQVRWHWKDWSIWLRGDQEAKYSYGGNSRDKGPARRIGWHVRLRWEPLGSEEKKDCGSLRNVGPVLWLCTEFSPAERQCLEG